MTIETVRPIDQFIDRLQLDKPVEVGKPREPHISKKINTARKAGYSDDQILKFLSEKDPRVSQALEAGHKPKDVLSFLSKQKMFGKEGWLAGGKVGNLIEGVSEYPSSIVKAIPEALAKAIEGAGAAFNPPVQVPGEPYKDPMAATHAIHQMMTEGLPEREAQAIEDVSDVESLLVPFLGITSPGMKGVPKAAAAKAKAPTSGGIPQMIREREVLSKGLGAQEKWVPETFPSGLTKPGAVEGKNVPFGLISKPQREATIQKLEKEAQGLFEKKVSERMPVVDKIKAGFDFDAHHSKEFGDLMNVAKKANPEIDITPINKFFSEEVEKLRGIRSPSPEKMKIRNEIVKFSRNPVDRLYDLLKNRRNNGAKLKGVYEKRLLKGTQQEYVDFLNRMNKKIDEAIGKSLPEDSQWFKQYQRMNKEFAEYKRGSELINILEPLMREKMSTTALTRIAEDPSKQKLLKIKMGEEAAQEIVQIARDLKKAREAIKKLSIKDANKFDSVWPISWAFKPVGALMTAKKGYDAARRFYGHVLLSPSKRKAFDELLEAVVEHDLPAYEKAAHKLDPQIEALAKSSIGKSLSKEAQNPNIVEKKTLEVNPEFKKFEYLDEPPQYLRSRDVGGWSSAHKVFSEKEWNKYLNPDFYEKYYTPALRQKNLGNFGSLIKDERLKKHFKEIEDVPVKISPKMDSMGRHSMDYSRMKKNFTNEFISIKPDLTPQQLYSTLMHEGTHALQARRINKKTGHNRLYSRFPEKPFASYEDYLKNLNEVNARKFEQWVSLPVNKYRSTLEKSKYAQKLLASQK